MITSHCTRVECNDRRVAVEFNFDDPYEAMVFYEHIENCLKHRLGFSINIDGPPPEPYNLAAH